MNKKHPHYDVIIAWAEGKPIQYRDECSGYKWRDCTNLITPYFLESQSYRVKPKPEVIRYRLYLYRDTGGNRSVKAHTFGTGCGPSKPGFVRWIGEEQSYTTDDGGGCCE